MNIETIVRGVCIKDGLILLCKGKKAELTYLPGGHIDFGESAREALIREIMEELGHCGEAGRFLGCCEHRFVQDGEKKSEINLVFELEIPGLAAVPGPLEAREAWISFLWHPVDGLADSKMEPACLREALPGWLRRPGGHCG